MRKSSSGDRSGKGEKEELWCRETEGEGCTQSQKKRWLLQSKEREAKKKKKKKEKEALALVYTTKNGALHTTTMTRGGSDGVQNKWERNRGKLTCTHAERANRGKARSILDPKELRVSGSFLIFCSDVVVVSHAAEEKKQS